MSILKCDNSLVNINFVIDVRHGKVLSDKGSTGKERPWRLHKLENIRLVQLYKSARHRERLISDARLFDLFNFNKCCI